MVAAEKQKAMQIATITRFSPDYPEPFRAIPDPPVFFFARGDISCLKMSGIAVVGTRDISLAGKERGELAGRTVASQGNAVVSGLAIGCDTATHRGCL